MTLFFVLAACPGEDNENNDPGDTGNMLDPVDVADLETGGTAALGLNDISVLFPVKNVPSQTFDEYLAASTVGADGVLLPRADFDRALSLINAGPAGGDKDAIYTSLRLLALRIDGCFKRPAGCERQIRVVFQPVVEDGSGTSANPADAAIHAFYRLDDTAFTRLIKGLRALRAYAAEQPVNAPLRISPTLSSQGINGNYGKRLKFWITRFIGKSNLVRMTFTTREDARASTWKFGGFEGDSVLPIAGISEPTQVLSVTNQEYYGFTATPMATTPVDITSVMTFSNAQTATAAQRKAGFKAILQIENPKDFGADDVQCASCHVAQPAHLHLAEKFASELTDLSAAFTSPRTLTPPTAADGPYMPDNGQFVRAFGWTHYNASVTQRVINETADALDYIEQNFPTQ